MNKTIVLLCGIMLAASGFTESGTLTLEQAQERARNNSPELRAARLNSQAAEKGVAAAGLWSNPELDIVAEGLGWDNDLYSEGEYTIGLMQKFQLGGKQKKERAAALIGVEVAEYIFSETTMGLLDQVRQILFSKLNHDILQILINAH